MQDAGNQRPDHGAEADTLEMKAADEATRAGCPRTEQQGRMAVKRMHRAVAMFRTPSQ